MDNPSPGRLLADRLLQLDEARNARPHNTQQPSEIVKERNARLVNQAEKIAALRRAREAAEIKPQLFEGDIMARKRELIDTGTDERYVRRNKLATSFVESDDVGRSLAADRRKRAKTKVKSGEGDSASTCSPIVIGGRMTQLGHAGSVASIEGPQAVLPPALRIAATSWGAFVGVDFLTDLTECASTSTLPPLSPFGWPMKVYSPAVVGVPQNTTSPTLKSCFELAGLWPSSEGRIL
jgi:hypothetical protein